MERTERTRRGPSWSDLPDELKVRILAKMPDKQRCNDFALVSQECLRLHLDNPPRPKTWHVSSPVSPSVFKWFSKTACGVESLEFVWNSDEVEPSCLAPQLVATAAVMCPNLRELSIDTLAPLGRTLPGVALYGQIRTLTIEANSGFTDRENFTAWRCLRGLTSLEDLCIQLRLGLGEVTFAGIDVFRHGLASLKRLRSFTFDLDGLSTAGEGGFGRELLESVSVLTQISRLRLFGADAGLEEEGVLPHYLGQLTQLTHFSFGVSGGDDMDVSPLFGLTRLASVSIQTDYAERLVTGFALRSPHLTGLRFAGISIPSVDRIFLDDMRSLSRLETLCLSYTRIDTLPIAMTAALRHLRKFELTSNKFRQIPATLSKIVTLRALDLSGNKELELSTGDLDTLAALSCLTSLGICKDSDRLEADLQAGFAPASLSVLHDIRERFPGLHLTKNLRIWGTLL